MTDSPTQVSINEFLQLMPPMVPTEQGIRRRDVVRVFGHWMPDESPHHPWDLMLYPFASQRPLRYFSDANIDALLHLYSENSDDVWRAISLFKDELTQALTTVTQAGPSWGREEEIPYQTPSDLQDILQVWHPEYQRYTEHAFNHLIQVPLALLERRTGRQYGVQALSNRVQLLSQLNLDFLARGFDPVVRNSISHGKSYLGAFGIRYQDLRESRELAAHEFSVLFDNMVEVCNELTLTLLLFVIRETPSDRSDEVRGLPLGILLLTIANATKNGGWCVEGATESEALGGRAQLNITATARIESRTYLHQAALFLAATIQNIGASHYDRLVVSFDCGRASPATIIIDMKRLARAREDRQSVSAIAQITEVNLLWYDQPKWLLRLLVLFRVILPASWRNIASQVYEPATDHNRRPPATLYELRHIRNVSTKSRVRLEARLALRRGVPPTRRILNSVVEDAAKRLRARPRRFYDIGGATGGGWWPSHIWFWVYAHDKPIRRLTGSLLHGALLEAEWSPSSSKPFYAKHYHTVIRGFRVQFAKGLGEDE